MKNSRIKTFISHSSKDRLFAGKFSNYIKRYLGFKTFLAHDDLSISDDWPPKILEKLKEADFVIPLLSNNFLCSSFANQEVGIALAKNKKIIPVSIDGTDPTGFIYHIHAHKCRAWTPDAFMEAVIKIFFLPVKHPNYRFYRQKSITSLIYALSQSERFRTSGTIVEMLIESGKAVRFNKAQLDGIISAAKGNPQVYRANLTIFPRLKQFLQSNYGMAIDK